MSEANHIVAELQHKLAGLDQKVHLYRQNMASEFEKYTEELLRNVPVDVSETVTQTMIESRRNCSLLFSDISIDNCAHLPKDPNIFQEPSALPETDSKSIASPSKNENLPSPSEHEMDLQGVFTPSYLPLLDRSSRERRSVFPRIPAKFYVDKGNGVNAGDFMQADASTNVTGSQMPRLDLNLPTPKRRYTDGASNMSGSSDNSTDRRSALRRSSSSPRARTESLRRVRFDVAGKEVLPTSSPSQNVQMAFNELNYTSFDSDEIIGSEINEDQCESPPPKRISSSQALRLLSRKSLEDDGTIWTTVCSSPEELFPDEHQQNSKPEGSPPGQLGLHQITLKKPLAKIFSPTNEDLFFSPHKKLCGESRTQAHNLNMPWASPDKYELDGDDDEDDREYLFNIDELSLDSEQKRVFMHQENSFDNDNHNDDDDDDESEFLTIKLSKLKFNQKLPRSQSMSSAISIPQASSTTYQMIDVDDLTNNSNRGHPFSIPIVRPEVHARAASLGTLDSFVGSVDGRTGLDKNKTMSISGSIGSPEKRMVERLRSGYAPKSLTERMLLEDLAEEE